MSNVERLYAPLDTDTIDDEGTLILDNTVFQQHKASRR